MKILVTGFSGFVSYHFLQLLNNNEPNATVMGIARHAPDFKKEQFPRLNIHFKSADLLDRKAISDCISQFQPEYILHLASVSSVAKSWLTPVDSFVNNTNIFLNLVEEVRIQKINCRILSVGSSEEFGEVNEEELPLTEAHTLKPVSPYAVARVSQEMLSKIYADGYGLDIIMTRSFNHIGPRQKSIFVVSSFAKQIVEIAKNSLKSNTIIVGNLDIIRDFVDVRDVVKAYLLLFKNGKSGDIYNICSGQGTRIGEIINKMAAIMNININTQVSTELIRPKENKKIIGSHDKITSQIGWNPSIPLENSIQDIMEYWDKILN